jgi:hypothetical protein
MKARLIIEASAFVLMAVIGSGAYIRLAPSDVARWHENPFQAFDWNSASEWGQVIAQTNGAVLRLPEQAGLLARLDSIAMANPHTTRIAGGVDQGRITWVTRSAFWGFPDYTTAQIEADGLYIHARQRFGKSDLGVNSARLTDWLAKL